MALTDNILAAFHFDESSGNASDSSPNANNLTNNGTVTYSTGKLANAAYFDGTSGMYFSRANASLTGLKNTGDQTISLWAYFTNGSPASGTFYAMVSLEATSAPAYNIGYGNEGGTLRFQYVTSSGGGSQTAGRVSYTLSSGTWYHIVFTYKSSTSGIEVFINGTSVGTATASAVKTADGNFQIGKTSGFGNTMYGRLDEVNVWSRVLTSSEITQLYNSGSGIAYPYPTSVTPTPSVVTGTFSVLSPTISAVRNATTAPSIVSGSFSVQSPSVSAIRNATIAPATVSGTFTLYAVTAGVVVTTTPSTVAGSFTVYDPTVAAIMNPTVSPSVVSGTFSVLAPSVTGEKNADVTITEIVGTFSIFAPSLSVTANPTILPDTIGGVLSVLETMVFGDFWQDKFETPTDPFWSNKY